ncbi:restriction endonuclease subunit S [Pseudomonas oryzihabitans]|uniref:Restriction endonuclease n=1 Tax=Pseudomonas oryzihabitans TaxID=47885 RepID=A0A2Z5A591_9PSED|nr:restriction endonuclease subunit S [Pseudomonas oryzihabitans]AXA65423.1 restriction endonuclease [Pseudomonas oryzihabitans]
MSFPAYQGYKDSGIEWLGEVPAHWKEKPFFSLVYERNEPNAGMKHENLLSLSYGCIVNKDINALDGLLPASFETYQVVHPGDIVFRLTDLQNDKRSLRSAIVRETGIITSAYLAVVCRGILPEFASFLFRAYDTIKVFYSMGGGLRQSMKYSDMKWLPIWVPDWQEQTQIAYFLDYETARIDALIEEQQRLIELLKEKRQAVISHAVTKGLDPTVPMKDSGVEWLGEVPAHWEVKQLKHVVDPNTSITYGIVQAGPEFEGGIPYIRTSDMSGEELPTSGYPLTSPEIDESYARSRVRPGDIVMSIRASVGKCLPVPDELKIANLTQGTAKISAGHGIMRNFLLAFLNAEATQNYFDLMAKGATFKEITLDALRRTPVLLPPLGEQIKIDQFVAKKTGLLMEACKQAIQSVSLLQERRSALISAAVTGKIDVRGWLPSIVKSTQHRKAVEA